MKRKICYILTIMMAIMFFSGCKSGESASGKNIKILFTYTEEENNDFRFLISQGAKEYAESIGAEVDIRLTGGSIEKQVEDIKYAAENNYDAVICVLENVDTSRQLMAAAGDMPIVFTNKSPDEELIVENKYIYVGTNEEKIGELQSEYILDKLSSKDEVNKGSIKDVEYVNEDMKNVWVPVQVIDKSNVKEYI